MKTKHVPPIFPRETRNHDQKGIQCSFPPRSWTKWEHVENVLWFEHDELIGMSRVAIIRQASPLMHIIQ